MLIIDLNWWMNKNKLYIYMLYIYKYYKKKTKKKNNINNFIWVLFPLVSVISFPHKLRCLQYVGRQCNWHIQHVHNHTHTYTKADIHTHTLKANHELTKSKSRETSYMYYKHALGCVLHTMITVSHTKCILYVYYVWIYLYDFETFFNASSSQTQLRSHHKKHKSVVESQKKK